MHSTAASASPTRPPLVANLRPSWGATDQLSGHCQGDDLVLHLVTTSAEGIEDGKRNVTP